MSRREQVASTMLELEQVLGDNDQADWAAAVATLRRRVERVPPDELPDVARDIRGLFGGMGSLTDIVLWVDGQAPVAANERLDTLRGQLYQLAGDLGRGGDA